MSLLPWYIAGPLIGLIVPLLLILREKQLGVSSSFRYAGSFILPKLSYSNYKKAKDAWQVQFSLGILVAAVVFYSFDLVVDPEIDASLDYGLSALEIYSLDNWWIFLFGGLVIGFGSRYADGCTAGHCIMGNSLFAGSSFVTTLGFFAGGLFVSHVVFPLIYSP